MEENIEINYQEKYIRLYADFENFRKNKEQEIARLKDTADIKAILTFADIFDSVYRAYHEYKAQNDVKSMIESFYLKFDELGVSTYGKVGETFDCDIHEAIASDNNPKYESGKITKVYCVGLKRGDTILRHAKVIVNA